MFHIPKFFLNLPGVSQALSLWIESERMSPADWERLRQLHPGEPRGNKEVSLVHTDPTRDYFREVPRGIKLDSPTFKPNQRLLEQPRYHVDSTLADSASKHGYDFNEALIWIAKSPSPLAAQIRLENKIQALKESVILAEIFEGPLAEEDYFAFYAVAKQRFFPTGPVLIAPWVFPSFERFKLYLQRLLSLPGLAMNLNETAFGILDPNSTFTRLATARRAEKLSWKDDFYFTPFDILLMWPPLNRFDPDATFTQDERVIDFPSIHEVERLLLENLEDDEVLGTFLANLSECSRVMDYMAAFELFKWRVASPQIFKVLKAFPNPMETLTELKKLVGLVKDPVDVGWVTEAPGSHLKPLWEAAIYIVVEENIYETYGKHVSYEAFESALALWGEGHVALASLVLATFQLNVFGSQKKRGETVFLDAHKTREELQSHSMTLTGLPLLAYMLNADLVKGEKWGDQKRREIANGAEVDIDVGAFASLNFGTKSVAVEFNPHIVMIVSAIVQAGGGNLNDFARLLRQVEIESEPDHLRYFPPYEFDIPTQTFSFQKEIQIGFLQKIANQVRIKDPLTLAQEILANYKRTIPKKWWRRLAGSFHVERMDGIEKKVSDLIKNEAQGIDFLQTLLLLEDWSEWWIANPLGKARELFEPYFIPKRWRTKPADKRLRPGVLLSILASVTLYFKYLGNDQKRIVDISQKISKEKEFSAMTPPEVAEAILLLHRFLNEELRGTIVERRDRLPTRKQMLKMRFYEEEEAEAREYSELFFSPEVRSALEKLKEAYGKMQSIAGPTVHVSFVAARQVVDAFNGYVSGICTAAEDYTRYCLSDSSFQPVRILVNGEYKGSFMTYNTTHEGKKILIVASLNAQVYFEPEKFMDHVLEYLSRFAKSAGYQTILIPKHEGGQSHDPALRREIHLRAKGEVDLGREIYFPRRGPGNDPKKDFYPHSHRQCWVLWEG